MSKIEIDVSPTMARRITITMDEPTFAVACAVLGCVSRDTILDIAPANCDWNMDERMRAVVMLYAAMKHVAGNSNIAGASPRIGVMLRVPAADARVEVEYHNGTGGSYTLPHAAALIRRQREDIARLEASLAERNKENAGFQSQLSALAASAPVTVKVTLASGAEAQYTPAEAAARIRGLDSDVRRMARDLAKLRDGVETAIDALKG